MDNKLKVYQEIECKFTKDQFQEMVEYLHVLKRRIDLKEAQHHSLEVRIGKLTIWLDRLEEKVNKTGLDKK